MCPAGCRVKNNLDLKLSLCSSEGKPHISINEKENNFNATVNFREFNLPPHPLPSYQNIILYSKASSMKSMVIVVHNITFSLPCISLALIWYSCLNRKRLHRQVVQRAVIKKVPVQKENPEDETLDCCD